MPILELLRRKFNAVDSTAVDGSSAVAVGRGGGPRSLSLAKHMLPEKLAKEDQWQRWRVSLEQYAEETQAGMKQKLEEVRRLKHEVKESDVGKDWWQCRRTCIAHCKSAQVISCNEP